MRSGTTARRRFAGGGGGPWLFGQYTVADAMYAPVVLRFKTTEPASRSGALVHGKRARRTARLQEWLQAPSRSRGRSLSTKSADARCAAQPHHACEHPSAWAAGVLAHRARQRARAAGRRQPALTVEDLVLLSALPIPQLSPDGRQVAFRAARDGHGRQTRGPHQPVAAGSHAPALRRHGASRTSRRTTRARAGRRQPHALLPVDALGELAGVAPGAQRRRRAARHRLSPRRGRAEASRAGTCSPSPWKCSRTAPR